jgi:hypothetical protein
MTYLLFTVTVTALDGSISGLSASEVLESLAGVLVLKGIMDAAVTMDSESISFTGQVEAYGADEAVLIGTTAMVRAGHTQIVGVAADLFKEEAHESDTYRVAVA